MPGKKRARAHIRGFPLPKVVTPSPVPHKSSTAKPTQEPSFATGIALHYLWVIGGSSGFMGVNSGVYGVTAVLGCLD